MLLLNLAGLAATAATALVPRQEAPLTSTCPANYEPTIVSTNATAGHIFTIFSPKNPETHNHALQLCPILLPDPALPAGIVEHTNPHTTDKAHFYGPSSVGCLLSSNTNTNTNTNTTAPAPVLLANLRDAGLYSQATIPSSPEQPFSITDAGPTAYLTRFDARGNTTRFNFTFTPNAVTDSRVEKEWQLTQIDWEGQYGLYHLTESGVVHGFALCDVQGGLNGGVEDGVKWKQMFYTRAPGFEIDEGMYPECEQVGLRTRVAPLIKNGECRLAPFDKEE